MQQKFRKFENSRAVLGPNALQGETGVAVPTKNGRPTREFSFNLTSDNLALQVSLSEGGKRVVSWVNPHKPQKPIISGPVILKKPAMQDKAHVASMSGKAYTVVSYPVGLGGCVHNNQRVSEVGESSRLPTMSSGVSAMHVASTGVFLSLACPNQALVCLTAKLVALHPDRKGDTATSSTTVESRHPRNLFCVGAGSNRAQGPQWEDSNCFSLLSNLDKEGDLWSEEEEEDVVMESHPEMNDGGVS